MSKTTEKIAAEHLMTATSGCTCGGMQLGEPYSRHVAEATEKAIRAQIAADIQRRKRDLADGYADIARAMLETGMEEAARIAEGR